MVGRSGMRIRIEEASAHAGAEVEIRGWLYHKRSSGSIHFLLVRDGSGVIQAVMAKQEVSPSLFAAAADLTQESSLLVRGTVREDSRAPGGHELTVRDLQVVGLADPYPITPKEHGVEFLMDHRHLWLRSRRHQARRHLTEFWMLEPEAAFMELDEYMEVAEAMICAVVGQVLDRRRLDLQEVERNLAALEAVQPPFPRLSYDEALNRLQAAGKPLPWGEGLGGG